MIVNKPIGAIKINKRSHKLTVGKHVPQIVVDYLKKNKQLKGLIENGVISEDKKIVKVKDDVTRSIDSRQSENSK